MLPVSKRLNIKKNFAFVAAGVKLENDLIKLLYRFGQPPTPQVGITVSSKVFKRAVDRNRARRLVSTSLEKLYNKLPEKVKIVIMPKEKVLGMRSEELTKEVEKLLKKAGLLKSK